MFGAFLAFCFQAIISNPLVVSNLPKSSGEVAYHRDYFYVGGGYADNGKGEHIFKDQMYVEHLTPVGGSRKKYPIVFVHGQAQTGTVGLTPSFGDT